MTIAVYIIVGVAIGTALSAGFYYVISLADEEL